MCSVPLAPVEQAVNVPAATCKTYFPIPQLNFNACKFNGELASPKLPVKSNFFNMENLNHENQQEYPFGTRQKRHKASDPNTDSESVGSYSTDSPNTESFVSSCTDAGHTSLCATSFDCTSINHVNTSCSQDFPKMGTLFAAELDKEQLVVTCTGLPF